MIFGHSAARLARSSGKAVALCAPAALLAGCLSAPTYGTGTRADMQLVQDISNLMSVSSNTNKAEIEYKPRAEIVAPASTDVLPAPQPKVTEAAQWPESPEQRRARIRAEATANQDNQFYQSPVVATGMGEVNDGRPLTPEEQRQRFKAAMQVQAGAYQGRRFLSDPPSDLKVAAATAPTDDLGEPESKKEARRKKLLRKNQGFSLRNLWPW
ncbi:MAG: hypothetical protein MUC58_03230 [Rhizobiaceae bacterium]|jgi:hypothetical protein|nr:hypothetical protein [Rhizobiaceae bacterium]